MSRRAENLAAVSLLLASILASAAAQLLLKAGMVSLRAQLVASESVFDVFLHGSVIWWVMGGFTCYAISLLAWLGVLARFALSFAYPFLSISYIIVYLVAVAWPRLAEPLSFTRLLGTLLVVAGVALVAASGRATKGKASTVIAG